MDRIDIATNSPEVVEPCHFVLAARLTRFRAQFRTSLSQMTSLDGEFVILGRKGTDNGDIFIPYGTGAQFSASFTGGSGRQEIEFLDGLKFAVESEFPLRMNVDLKYPLDEKDIPEGMMALSMRAQSLLNFRLTLCQIHTHGS